MSVSRFRTPVVIAIAIVSTVLPMRIGEASAIFSATRPVFSNDFAGATFTPSVAPAISARDTGNAILLSWPVVSISSGVTVDYEIVRSSGGVSQVVCTAPGAITLVTTTSTLQCRDDTAQPLTFYTYTEQPYVSVGGVRTWSLPASTPSDPACVKRCR